MSSANSLDFRDIHEHPIVSSTETPDIIVDDPSWDAHKVFFNERNKSEKPKTKGDDFDLLFNDNISDCDPIDIVFPIGGFEEKKEGDVWATDTTLSTEIQDETLDPLGWPIAPEFQSSRTTTPTPTNNNNNNSVHSSNYDEKCLSVDDFYASDLNDRDDIIYNDEENDDSNLLQRKSDDDDDEQKIPENGDDIPLDDDDVDLSKICLPKNERIVIYDTTGVDEDSSDEEDDDDDDFGAEEIVQYVAQQEEEDETLQHDDHHHEEKKDDNEHHAVVNTFFRSFEETSPVFSAFDVVTPPVAAAAAATAVATAVAPDNEQADDEAKTASSGSVGIVSTAGSAKDKIGSKSIPLIRPPPKEKVKKWEESKKQAAKDKTEE